MEIKKYWNILRRRAGYLFAVWAGVVLVSVIVVHKINKVYQSTALVKLEHLEEAQTLVPRLSPEFGALQNITQAPTYTEVTAVLSSSVLDPVIEKLGLMKRRTFLDRKPKPTRLLRADELAATSFLTAFLQQRALSVRPLPNTDVIQISAYDTTLAGARDLTNSVTASYVSFMQGLKRYASTEGQRMLERELGGAQADLTRKQDTMRRFQEQFNVVNLSEQSRSAVGQLATLQNTIADARRRLSVTQDRLTELQRDVSKLREPSNVTAQVEASPQIQNLLTRYNDLNAQLQSKLAVQTREHPEVRALSQQIDDVQTSLQREVQRIFGIAIADLRGDIVQYERELAIQNAAMARFPAREVRLADLQRQVEEAQKNNAELRGNLDAARTVQQLNLSNVTVLQWGALPDPSNPYYPKAGLTFAIAFLLGGLLGLGAALIADYLDQSYRSGAGAQAALKLPLTGAVRGAPRVAREPHGQALAGSGAIELAYNVSRLVEQGRKALLVTSASQKDAKTEVSAVLATALARRGIRTVLVDLDPRSRVHSQNGASASPGMSGVLLEALSADEVIVPGEQENLSLLPLGTRGPEVAAELDAPHLAQTLKTLRATYDAVVINAPAVLPSGEMVALTSAADAVLFVVGLNRTQAPLIVQAKRRLDDAGAPIAGLVTSTA